MELNELMKEIDVKVQRLIDNFSFLLTYRELFRGTGLEFAQLKEYVPGEDDASRIDWKASLRTDDIFVKQYEEERDLNIIVLLDTSSSMLFGTKRQLKSEFAGLIAGAIIRAGIKIGDNVGFGIFSNGIDKFFEPSNEDTMYYKSLNMIVDDNTYGNKCDLKNSLRYILNNIDEDSYLFIISDFIGLNEGWENSLKMVSGKLNGVIGIMVRDERDEKLPKGSGKFRLQDPYSGNTIVIDLDKAKDKFEKLAKEQSENVKTEFRRSDCGFIKVFTDEPFIKNLIQEMRLKKF
ncbi:MAG: DUF58 domain-containing protein [Candidatus Aenigmatarchaeota archaeon]